MFCWLGSGSVFTGWQLNSDTCFTAHLNELWFYFHTQNCSTACKNIGTSTMLTVSREQYPVLEKGCPTCEEIACACTGILLGPFGHKAVALSTCSEHNPVALSTCSEHNPVALSTCSEHNHVALSTCSEHLPVALSTCCEHVATYTCSEHNPVAPSTCSEHVATYTCSEHLPVALSTCSEHLPVALSTCSEWIGPFSTELGDCFIYALITDLVHFPQNWVIALFTHW